MSGEFESTGLVMRRNIRRTMRIKRKPTNLYLPENLIQKAKEYKLNLSKIMEKVLSDIITYLEGQQINYTSQIEGMGELSHGPVAQQGLEHRAFNPGVAGSNPAGPANFLLKLINFNGYNHGRLRA